MWFDTRIFSFLSQLSIMHSLRVNIASLCAIYFFFGFCLPVYFALGLRLLSEKSSVTDVDIYMRGLRPLVTIMLNLFFYKALKAHGFCKSVSTIAQIFGSSNPSLQFLT